MIKRKKATKKAAKPKIAAKKKTATRRYKAKEIITYSNGRRYVIKKDYGTIVTAFPVTANSKVEKDVQILRKTNIKK